MEREWNVIFIFVMYCNINAQNPLDKFRIMFFPHHIPPKNSGHFQKIVQLVDVRVFWCWRCKQIVVYVFKKKTARKHEMAVNIHNRSNANCF